MNQKRKPTILKMSWRTKKEKIDCGLYMMLHMEHYQGKSGPKWDTGMLKENDINHRMQTNNLRAKYVTKMMLHDVNDNKKMMSDYALKFAAENPDEEEAKTLVEEAIKIKIAEQEKQEKCNSKSKDVKQ